MIFFWGEIKNDMTIHVFIYSFIWGKEKKLLDYSKDYWTLK